MQNASYAGNAHLHAHAQQTNWKTSDNSTFISILCVHVYMCQCFLFALAAKYVHSIQPHIFENVRRTFLVHTTSPVLRLRDSYRFEYDFSFTVMHTHVCYTYFIRYRNVTREE